MQPAAGPRQQFRSMYIGIRENQRMVNSSDTGRCMANLNFNGNRCPTVALNDE